MTATESARLRAPLAALTVALALAALLGFVSRAVNRPPVILGWGVEPAAHTPLVLRVRATDPDGDVLRYAYETQQGRIVADAAQPETARYTPPVGVGTMEGRVTVTVTDPRGLTATATTSIKMEAAVPEVAPGTPAPENAAAIVGATEEATPSARPLAATPRPLVSAPGPGAASAPALPSTRRSAAAPLPTTAAPPVLVEPPMAAAPPAPEYVDAPESVPPSPRPARRGPRDAATSTASTSTSDAKAPEATPPPNHAPVLDKGTTIEGLGIKSVVLAANGYDPDGDPIEHEWDTKGCFEILNQTQSSAEVKFGYCTWGVVRLTWKDPQGLTAYTEWTISK